MNPLAAGRLVVRGLFVTARTLIGGPVGLILLLPDLVRLVDWLARVGFGVELCLTRTAGDALDRAWDFLFAWTDPATLRNKYERMVMCTVTNITILLPPPGLQWVAAGELDPTRPDQIPVILFTYEGRLWACGLMELPLPPESDACGPIRRGPQFVVWLQQASYAAYRDGLNDEIRARIEPALGANADVEAPVPRGLQWYLPQVARMVGAVPAL